MELSNRQYWCDRQRSYLAVYRPCAGVGEDTGANGHAGRRRAKRRRRRERQRRTCGAFHFPAWRDPNIESEGIRAEWFYGRQYTWKAWLVFLGLSRPSGPSSLTPSVHHTTPRRPAPRLVPTPPQSLVRLTLLPLRPVLRTAISTQTGFSTAQYSACGPFSFTPLLWLHWLSISSRLLHRTRVTHIQPPLGE